MYLSLTKQLQHFFEQHHTDELYCNSRKKKHVHAIEDIFDGFMYKNRFPDGNLNNTISMNFSVDGTPLFKSSSMSMTPILCTINKQHPKSRKSIC